MCAARPFNTPAGSTGVSPHQTTLSFRPGGGTESHRVDSDAPLPPATGNSTEPVTIGGRQLPTANNVDTAGNLGVAVRHLTVWRDGISFDDGILRRYDDSTTGPILSAIHSGTAPASILNVAEGQGVDMRLLNHINVNYFPNAPWPPGYDPAAPGSWPSGLDPAAVRRPSVQSAFI
ncbi:hypothetical protein B0H13DRAFT_1980608 [Mycena leptocephala]|nr:hypothetical protein B0H13DRAFT_1980608 [Mycena leptocephala]